MNILFVPFIGGGEFHIIPVYVLYKRYFSKIKEFNCAFLLPNESRNIIKDKGVNVIEVDYGFKHSTNSTLEIQKQSLENHKSAREVFKTFYPDLVIEDLDLSAMGLCKEYDIPRISIQRTGIFRATNPETRNLTHCHSVEKVRGSMVGNRLFRFEGNEGTSEDVFLAKIFAHGSLIDVFNANIRLVPGIPSIEELPPLRDTSSFRFCGPLLVKDNPSEKFKNELDNFWNTHKNRKRVLVTTGLVERRSVNDIIEYLLDRDYAVLTTCTTKTVLHSDSRLFFSSLLPLNEVCSNVELVVHHCGSEMYHYPLLHQKPAITIGTQCYDREEVALRLQELKLSIHIPAEEDNPDYMEHFKAALACFENGTLSDGKKLAEIKEEIISTMLSFDVNEAVEFAMEAGDI